MLFTDIHPLTRLSMVIQIIICLRIICRPMVQYLPAWVVHTAVMVVVAVVEAEILVIHVIMVIGQENIHPKTIDEEEVVVVVVIQHHCRVLIILMRQMPNMNDVLHHHKH
ncbi:hypothetical protein FF38_10915, partial [Lucilia cuprina]